MNRNCTLVRYLSVVVYLASFYGKNVSGWGITSTPNSTNPLFSNHHCKVCEVYGLLFQQTQHKIGEDTQSALVQVQIGSKLRDD